MDWIEFAKGAGGTSFTLLLFAVYLNYKGTLLWRSQVEREIKVLVDSAAREIKVITDATAKLDSVRLEQIKEERDDKDSWKAVCDTLKTSLDMLRAAMEGKVTGGKIGGP